ncbi:hypothetical protein FGU65_07175 [Methanoculleus sp. FWC-SCC1]|uniref:Phosphate-starvation-inducible E n=1 Tax=Methanoculleus frigidifontis TaxID=2584085 RepID=A0ABT8M9Q3_9EURY|nr:phosphate-starvation-inducible PsiE family protein [Methanoculleus sp. FWC-SCC1]MDN7024671.1 hypothetical protein [Methanoculleus sp. FWC-SCC1]
MQNRHVTTIINVLTNVTLAIYLAIAIGLSILAILSIYDVALLILDIFTADDMTLGVLAVLHALLLTIIIIELLDTVTLYFKTNRLQVTPILIAGLTAMVRRILTFGVEPVEAVDVALTIVAILILTVAIVYIGKQERGWGSPKTASE